MTGPALQDTSRRRDWIARLLASFAVVVAGVFAFGWFDAHQKMRRAYVNVAELESRFTATFEVKGGEAEGLEVLLQKLGVVQVNHDDLIRRLSVLTKERVALAAAVEGLSEMRVARHVMESNLSSLGDDRLPLVSAIEAIEPGEAGSEDLDARLAVPGDGSEQKAIRQQIAKQEDIVRHLILVAATRQYRVTGLQAEADTLAGQFSADLEMIETALKNHLAATQTSPVGLAAAGGQHATAE